MTPLGAHQLTPLGARWITPLGAWGKVAGMPNPITCGGCAYNQTYSVTLSGWSGTSLDGDNLSRFNGTWSLAGNAGTSCLWTRAITPAVVLVVTLAYYLDGSNYVLEPTLWSYATPLPGDAGLIAHAKVNAGTCPTLIGRSFTMVAGGRLGTGTLGSYEIVGY